MSSKVKLVKALFSTSAAKKLTFHPSSHGIFWKQWVRNVLSTAAAPQQSQDALMPYRVASYEQHCREALDHPEEYWAEQAERIVWYKKWDRVLDNDKPPFTRWFVGGELNTCYNAIDRHVDSGVGDKFALIYDSPVTNTKRWITYKEMQDLISRFAGVLANEGVVKGDRVLIYMPMIPEAIISMLACARLGAIHVVVFGGFAAKELAVRIQHSQPKVVISASAGVEPNKIVEYKPILDEAIEFSTVKPKSCIIYQRPNIGETRMIPGRDKNWDTEMEKAKPAPCASVLATDPLYILHTSGTTGLPKGVVRPSGGHAVILPWTMQTIYNFRQDDVWWAASDLGWVVGHSYICYAPLLYGATTVLYEGKPVGTPDAGQFFRVVAEHGASSFFCAPTALRSIHQADAKGIHGSKYNMNKLRYIFSAGEHLDYETRLWAEKMFKVPVLDHWWQTESGYPICAPCVGCPDANLCPPQDSSGRPVPGWNVGVLDENGAHVRKGELGRIVVRLPLPPGSLSTLWKNDEKFVDTYFKQFPGYYDTQDAGFKNEEGVFIMSRADDVINVAGHRISSGALEEAILFHYAMADCAVIGVNDKLKGTIPVAICVLRDDYEGDRSKIEKEVVKFVRDYVGPVASLKTVILVPKLPRTRSGKIARNTLAAMADNRPYKVKG